MTKFNVRKVAALYGKEMNTYFASPLAYIFSMIFLLVTGYFFWFLLIDSRKASMRETFSVLASMLLFVTPILTMRLLAEERKSGTLELLFTSPLSSAQIIFGKFLAALSAYALIFLFTLVYPVILFALGQPELGPIFSGYMGLLGMAACYTAVGLFTSSLTENQIIAGISSFSILLGFLAVDWLKNYLQTEWLGSFFSYLGFFKHYEAFGKGIVSVPDFIYFLTFVGFFLFLSIRSLESQRNQ